MQATNSKNEAPKSNTGNQQEAEKNEPSPPINKNPNPRANENMPDKDKEQADTSGPGSEITDGEDG